MPTRVRFGDFVLDLHTGELFGSNSSTQLGENSLRVLRAFLERGGELVTREILERRIWPEGTVVDFEHGINTAMKVLRRALGDAVDNPKYIETIPRRGYRLLVPVEWIDTKHLIGNETKQEAQTQTADQRSTAGTCLVAREKELAELTRNLGQALAGHGSILLLGGEPGIGKTRLAAEFISIAHSQEAVVLRGSCYEAEGAPPYVPFIEVMESFARQTTRAQFRDALGEDAPELARLMPELRRTLAPIPSPLELPPEHQRRFFFKAYRAFVERSAHRRTLLILLEDLHSADEPTLQLLQYLAQAVLNLPVCLVVTYRDTDIPTGKPAANAIEFLIRNRLAMRISLRRLQPPEVAEMLAVLSAQNPPAALSRVVFEKTDGNPFFVEEVFRHLVEEGALFNADGSFPKGFAASQLKVPDGVHMVLSRRLGRLSDNTRRILSTAAVLGRAFALDLLEKLEAGRPGSVLEALEEAERARLVEAHPGERETRYRFVHELVRQTLAEMLSVPRRQRLHAQAAQAMQEHYQQSIDSHVTAIAHHLWQAGPSADREITIDFLCRAADISGSAYEEALEHLHHALALIGPKKTARIAKLLAQRAGIQLSLQKANEAIEDYRAAVALNEELGNEEGMILASEALWFVYGWTGDFTRMNEVAEHAVQRTEASRPELRYAALAMQGGVLGLTGKSDAALACLNQLPRLPAESENPGLLASGLHMAMHAWHLVARLDLCEAAARQGIVIADRTGDSWMRCSLDFGVLASLIYRGRPQDYESHIHDLIDRSTRVGHDNMRFQGLYFLASTHLASGKIEAAESELRNALEFGGSHKVGFISAAQSSLAGVQFFRDNLQEAETGALQALGGPVTHLSGFGEGLLALVKSVAGNDDTERFCTQAAQFLPRPGHSRSIGVWHAVLTLIEAYAFASRRDLAAALVLDAERIAAEWDCSIFSTPAWSMAGVAAACGGDWTRAERHHQASVARMDEGNYITARPIARFWYARMLIERGRPADVVKANNLLHDSAQLAESIGLALYARLARTQLNAINARNINHSD